ncbi:MAG TPA: hypothetical protein DCQ98_03980 [Planctomycetaceae bacterium]|nr:hypothetical protein [Planctomycetaceae bacterium]
MIAALSVALGPSLFDRPLGSSSRRLAGAPLRMRAASRSRFGRRVETPSKPRGVRSAYDAFR